MWEYLKTFDEREVLIAHYVNKYVDGGTLLDLDCGNAPLFKHLGHFYYIGNDLLNTQPPINQFLNVSDSKMVNIDFPDPNVIVLMGMGGHEISQEPSESPTVTRSLKKLVEKYSPELVIQESIQQYSPLFQLFEDYEEVRRINFEIPTTPDMQRVFKRCISVQLLKN